VILWDKVKLIFKIKELRGKILFVLAILAVFRVAANIPVPGVDIEKLKSFFDSNQLFGLINIFTGGAMSNLSMALILQLLLFSNF